MEHLNVFLTQAAIVLLPGIVWARMDTKYAVKEKPSDVDFLLRAFIYGLASYAATFIIYAIAGYPFAFIDVAAAENANVITGRVAIEIAAATLVGFFLAVVWIYLSNWKILTRFLQAIGATKRYGDEDVWDFTFNSPGQSVRFVNVRDFDKQIVYTGKVNAFSETDKLRELTLYDVEIYDFDGNLIYAIPRLYIARKPDDIHIEFPIA